MQIVIDNHMSLCDNFRLYNATLANKVANLVANAIHVYLSKLYKADRKAHSCIVLPTLSKSLLMVTAKEVSQTRNSYTHRRNSTKLHFTCLLAIARTSSLSLPVQRWPRKLNKILFWLDSACLGQKCTAQVQDKDDISLIVRVYYRACLKTGLSLVSFGLICSSSKLTQLSRALGGTR